mmetsp:Transcript_38972/g.66497  ORF Transcript_38972/g.66497 Transcript_38972/m.66497 type:complete len:103 (+) Transcript_38972:384-692(+)
MMDMENKSTPTIRWSDDSLSAGLTIAPTNSRLQNGTTTSVTNCTIGNNTSFAVRFDNIKIYKQCGAVIVENEMAASRSISILYHEPTEECIGNSCAFRGDMK